MWPVSPVMPARPVAEAELATLSRCLQHDELNYVLALHVRETKCLHLATSWKYGEYTMILQMN